jgi:nucleotide-binding universal stress UspA family protein
MARRFLVPLDGSPGSETVLAHVADLARAESAIVRLLHVTAPPQLQLGTDGRVLAYADQVAAGMADEAQGYLRSLKAALPGVVVETAVRFGDPAEEIVAEAERGQVALVAMASHRRQGVRRLVAGSVAERVGRLCPVPVLLVDHGERPPVAEPLPEVNGRRVRRRFWCASSGRDVEVDFVERGIPGFPTSVAVTGCSAFEPPTAIDCQRRCADVAFRRQWEAALPLFGRGGQ